MKSQMPPKANGRSDIFQTKDPHIALRGLMPHIAKYKSIWCCASGEGRMVNYLRSENFDVTGTDIMAGFDFLDRLIAIPDCEIIVENPPFSIKDKWIERCYEIGKPFALLLPITAMDEQDRVSMYKQNGIQILLPKKRIEFITPNGTEGGGWFYTAWFCWNILPDKICYE